MRCLDHVDTTSWLFYPRPSLTSLFNYGSKGRASVESGHHFIISEPRHLSLSSPCCSLYSVKSLQGGITFLLSQTINQEVAGNNSSERSLERARHKPQHHLLLQTMAYLEQSSLSFPSSGFLLGVTLLACSNTRPFQDMTICNFCTKMVLRL